MKYIWSNKAVFWLAEFYIIIIIMVNFFSISLLLSWNASGCDLAEIIRFVLFRQVNSYANHHEKQKYTENSANHDVDFDIYRLKRMYFRWRMKKKSNSFDRRFFLVQFWFRSFTSFSNVDLNSILLFDVLPVQ